MHIDVINAKIQIHNPKDTGLEAVGIRRIIDKKIERKSHNVINIKL